MTRIKFVNGSLLTVLLSVIYFSTAAAADNVVAIVANGSPVTNGGLDGERNAYSANLLGTSLSFAGSMFELGAPGTFDAARNTTIALPARNASTVNLLATAINGNQPNQSFVVTYTDGTTKSFTQSVSDWMTPQQYGGESKVSKMAYRVTESGATQNGPFYLYGYSFAVNSAKTVQSITLPHNSNVVVLGVDVSTVDASAPVPPSAATVTASGSMSQVENVVGIVAEGSPVANGGLDGGGYAYAANLLGASLNWSGSTFKLGAPGSFDAASAKTIALPAANASTVNLLATAVNGNQPNQNFVVTYTDGTSKSFTQSLSDWYAPQQYGGESKVSDMAYRITPTGATDNRTFYLYGYSFTVNSAKTVQSITLPNNRNVVVLAVNVSATGTTSTPTPPAPTSIKSPVYLDGKFDWAGDWNSVPFNYAQAGAGVNGPGPVIGMPGDQPWEYWLPYPPHNSAGPASNGTNFDLSGLTYFTIAIKPSKAGAAAQMQFYRANGGANDIAYGTMLNISQGKYGPATMVAGQWNVYKIPLADFGVSGWIYKFIVQQQGVTPQSWEIDQVGFE